MSQRQTPQGAKKGQEERGLPLTPTVSRSPLVEEPSKCETHPLQSQCHTMTQECSRPGDQDWEGPNKESVVPLRSSVADELHAPVKSAEEREDDGAVGDLQCFKGVECIDGFVKVDAEDSGFSWKALARRIARITAPGRCDTSCDSRLQVMVEESEAHRVRGDWLLERRRRYPGQCRGKAKYLPNLRGISVVFPGLVRWTKVHRTKVQHMLWDSLHQPPGDTHLFVISIERYGAVGSGIQQLSRSRAPRASYTKDAGCHELTKSSETFPPCE